MAGEADTPRRPDHVPSAATPLAAKALQAARTPRAQEAPSDAPEPMAAPPPAAQPARSVDPLARPYDLPSGGLFYREYGGHNVVRISPTRGEQEEVLAGAADSPQARLAVLRDLTEQCIDTGPIPFDELLLEDWMAAMLHFLAYSMGSDTISLSLQHGSCSPFNVVKSMSELPCRYLQLVAEGEEPTWPSIHDIDDDLSDAEAILMAMEREAAETLGTEFCLVAERDTHEPFETGPLPITGEVVSWRKVRVRDMKAAEDFSSRLGNVDTSKGSPLHSYLMALQIVAINGAKVSRLQAVRWVKQSVSPTLSAFRDHTAAYSFGFDTRPTYRCPCGVSFRRRLPLDEAIFRRRPVGS